MTGVPFTNELIVDEACFAKGAVLPIGRTTTHKAVVGRAPNRPMLRSPPMLRCWKTRRMCIGHVPESWRSARSRSKQLARASSVPCRLCRESQAKLWTTRTATLVTSTAPPPLPPSNKDMGGWRGPAIIVDVSPETLSDGIVHVRWGGRLLICKLQDVRHYIMSRRCIT